MREEPTLKHGTVNAYVHHACRCKPCCGAWSIYRKNLKQYHLRKNVTRQVLQK